MDMDAEIEQITTHVIDEFLQRMITVEFSDSHGDAMRYRCQICGKTHSRHGKTQRHLLKRHNHQLLEFTLNMSSEIAGSYHSPQALMKRITNYLSTDGQTLDLGTTWICEFCGFGCASEEELASHLETFHPFG